MLFHPKLISFNKSWNKILHTNINYGNHSQVLRFLNIRSVNCVKETIADQRKFTCKNKIWGYQHYQSNI